MSDIYITTHNHIITLVIYAITSPQYIYIWIMMDRILMNDESG